MLPVTTPPTCPDATASLRQSILPSPPTMRLGHRTLRFTREPLRSLALRPGDSLAIHKMTLSIGFSSGGFPPGCYPSYGASGSYPGGTNSHWTHLPYLDTRTGTRSVSSWNQTRMRLQCHQQDRPGVSAVHRSELFSPSIAAM